MKYRALVRFADLKDGRHLYEVGDTYPREGLTVGAVRLDELSSNRNAAGYPLIAAVPEQEKRSTRKRGKKNEHD